MSTRVIREFITPKTLADAELDHRVAHADARDAYRAAVVKARHELVAATRRADVTLAHAQERLRSAELNVANLRAYYRERPRPWLVEDLERFRFMQQPGYAVHADRRQGPLVQMHVELISAEIARRDAEDS